MKLALSAAAAAVSLCVAPHATAGEAFFGVYSHDIDDRISRGTYETSPQLIGGVRTTALDELSFIGRPRVHLFGALNTSGGTNYLATGLSWRFALTKRFYVQPGVGVAIHDGPVNLPSPDAPGITLEERQKRIADRINKLDLGSRVLFEPEFSVGYVATDRLSVELSWIHLSHAQLAGRHNPGLGDLGVRVLYRYGLDR
jgi:lipid A 3-O-deacylase